MKYLAAFAYAFAAAVLLTVALPTHGAGSRAEIRDTVRMLGDRRCSGVVIQPGVVLTAQHCLAGDGSSLTIGGVAPRVLAQGDDRLDYALLQYPDAVAPCPCAPVAEREAERDEAVDIVGFPLGLGVQVLTTGHSQGVQDNPHLPYGRRLVTTALVAGGNSGGGVFVFRNGEFMLVGLLVEMNGHLTFAIPLADVRPFIAPYTYIGYNL